MSDQFGQQPERMPWNQPDDQDNTHRKIPPTAAAGQSRPDWPQSGPGQSGRPTWPQTESGQSRPGWPQSGPGQSGPGWPSTPLTPPVSMPPPPPSGGTFGSFASGASLPPPPPPPTPYDVPPSAPVQYPVHTAMPMSQPIPAPGYMPGYTPVYVPAQVVKKPIYFPLTRKRSALRQIISMLLYTVIMILSLMGCLLYMQDSYHPGASASIYVNPNGGTNVLAIVLTVALGLLVLPACSLLSGALFGSWRGLFLSLLSLAGGLFLTYYLNHQFIPGNPSKLTETNNVQGYLLFAGLPISALVVGLIYDRRKYAGWGTSLSTILLGAAVQVIWLVVTALIISAQASSTSLLSSSSLNSQTAFATLGVGLGCSALLAIPVLTFPIAIVEGVIHGRIAAIKRK